MYGTNKLNEQPNTSEILQQLMCGDSLYEEMKKRDYKNKNTLYLDCSIRKDSINLLARQLKFLGEAQLLLDEKSRTPIKLLISSPGGCHRSTMYFCDLMEYYIKRGVEIHTITTSYAYSGAFKIAICGSKRFGYPRSSYMCHQWNRYREGYETYQDTVNEREENDRAYEELCEVINSKTKITREMMDEYTKANKDFYMNSKTALELSVIDEIIE